MSAAAQRRAVIDIGTNSVKLLVAEVAGQSVTPLWERGEQTRLGEGFYDSRLLQPAAIARTLKAVAGFQERARELEAASIRVIATSAARDARNGAELTAAIASRTGLTVEVLSGHDEAGWAFRGATAGLADPPESACVIDVGGGSTECTVGVQGSLRWSESFHLGTVRWLEKIRPGNPPQPAELSHCRESIAAFLNQHVAPDLAPALARLDGTPPPLIGVGGTFGILARMELKTDDFDRDRIEATPLSRATLAAWTERLWTMTYAQRGALPGLPPERADVMLMGAAIIEQFVLCFRFESVRPSSRGLRFAALMN